jgi:hypothetical protein
VIHSTQDSAGCQWMIQVTPGLPNLKPRILRGLDPKRRIYRCRKTSAVAGGDRKRGCQADCPSPETKTSRQHEKNNILDPVWNDPAGGISSSTFYGLSSSSRRRSRACTVICKPQFDRNLGSPGFYPRLCFTTGGENIPLPAHLRGPWDPDRDNGRWFPSDLGAGIARPATSSWMRSV